MGFDAIFNRSHWTGVPFHFWSAVIFWLGCMVGSFLNVCIHRMPLSLSVVTPPSHCPHCKYSIPWYLNVPLLTWLMLRGKCKNCGAPISIRYFLVELLTGLMFLAAWLAFGRQSAPMALVYCLFLAGLIAATFIDFEHFIIPDEITIGGMVAGFILSVFVPGLHEQTTLAGAIKQSLLGLGVGWAIIYFIVRLGKVLFGRLNLDLDPGSRVIFHETGIAIPPKSVNLKAIVRLSSGWIAFRAERVETVDRCHLNVEVGVSKDALIIAGERYYAHTAPHVELIVSKVLSPAETARLAGAASNPRAWMADSLRDGTRLGLSLFGVRRWPHLGVHSHLIIENGALWLCRDGVNYEDIFYRKSDKIQLRARQVETLVRRWTDVDVQMTHDELRIGTAAFNPEAVPQMTVVTDALVVPREAMGLGDVKFMAAIGAFLGWQATVFSLLVSSTIGAGVGVGLIVMRKQHWSSRLPYGPYIALAALLWLFWGRAFCKSFYGMP